MSSNPSRKTIAQRARRVRENRARNNKGQPMSCDRMTPLRRRQLCEAAAYYGDTRFGDGVIALVARDFLVPVHIVHRVLQESAA